MRAWEPPVTPELIAILAMSATLAGLMVAIWRDARAHTDRGLAEIRAEMRNQRTDIQSLRQEVRSDVQGLREESRADIGEVRTGLEALRQDVQALTERTSRVEGVIQGLFGRRDSRDRHDDAA